MAVSTRAGDGDEHVRQAGAAEHLEREKRLFKLGPDAAAERRYQLPVVPQVQGVAQPVADQAHAKHGGRIVSVAVTVAVAVNDRGRREVLGMAIGASEAETFWTGFLRSLTRRGLRGVKLVIADDHKGLGATTGARWWQGKGTVECCAWRARGCRDGGRWRQRPRPVRMCADRR